MSARFILYTTLGCHLCEDAKALLWQVGIEFTEIDIAESDALVVRYGVRIPVLLDANLNVELSWPFDVEQLREFVVRESSK